MCVSVLKHVHLSVSVSLFSVNMYLGEGMEHVPRVVEPWAARVAAVFYESGVREKHHAVAKVLQTPRGGGTQ